MRVENLFHIAIYVEIIKFQENLLFGTKVFSFDVYNICEILVAFQENNIGTYPKISAV